MKTKSLKKIMTSLLVFTMLCSPSLGAFSNVGTVLLGATDAPEVAPDSSVSSDVTKEAPADTTIANQVAPSNIVEPNVIDVVVNSASSTNNVTVDTTINQTSTTSTSPSTLEVVPTDMCVDPSDIDDPEFTEPSISIIMPEGGIIDEYRYNPYSVEYEDELGNIVQTDPAATDEDPDVTYELILGDFKNDGTDAPGVYTIESQASDTSCNVTGEDDADGLDNPNQEIMVTVLPTPVVYAPQDNFSTTVNLEFVYDRSLYPEGATAYLLVVDMNTEEVIDEMELDIDTTTLDYDQGNYEDYTYFYFVNIGTEDFIYGEATANMIQLPTINSLSANVSDDSKTININYDISLNDFPGAIAYIEVNGERVATLDPNKNSITYAVPGYGTYDIKLVLDYSESADFLTASTTVEVKPPSNLAYTGLDTSVFENFILFLQDFITNIFK